MQVYKITNLINNKIYIGKDKTSNPNYFGSGVLIKRSISKYGINNFHKEILYETEDYADLSEKEIYYINFYNSNNLKIGYNISSGGDGGDTLSNHPELDFIKEKISKNSFVKGKSYEEAFGDKKAKEYKKKLSISNNQPMLGKKYEDVYSLEKTNRIKRDIGENTKKHWTDKRKKEQSKLAKKNISNSLLSEKSIEKNRKYLDKRWSDWRIKENDKVQSLVKENDIDGLISYLNKLPNTLFNNRKEFYRYVGNDIELFIKQTLNSRKKINSSNEKNKKKILIDGVLYESISKASEILNIDRSLIRYRLKSKNFKNYKYELTI